MQNTLPGDNDRSAKDTRSRKEQSELGARVAKLKNNAFDYKQRSTFLTTHAPNQAAKHVDLVLKNRKDNQQRK